MGSRIIKQYEPYRTPYERLIASKILSEKKKSEMEKNRRNLNPAELIRQINRLQFELERCQKDKRNGLTRKVY